MLEFTNKNKKTVEQLISPKNLPEAGFQSYGELVSDALDQKDSFIFGDVRNPELTHSRFQDLAHIDKSILNLVSAKEQASDMVGDPIFREAISSSLDFRAAEMEYVKLAARLEFLRKENGSKSDAHEVAEQMRTLGHELYGEPKSEIRDAALNELWSELDSKEYHESAQKIYDELVNGATWNGAQLSGLMRAEDAEAKLPRFEDNEALDWFGEKVIEQNADIQALVNEYWTQMIEENGEGYECGPEDIVEVFQHVINMRDPSGESGVSVRLADGRTALSWETPEMAVLVGSKRGAIKNPDELFRKVLHEFGVHGQRAVNGLKTDLPVLGTGLFTDTPRPDSLTFEEGLATTIEETVGDMAPKWNAVKLGHYINISMAEAGADFRAVFENAWRYRLLSNLKDNEIVTQEMITKTQSLAYKSCVRIFRGTQPDLAEAMSIDVAPLTFNKDLAYLDGRILAMKHIQELFDERDIAGVERLFAGKFDATNPVQNELVKRATGSL